MKYNFVFLVLFSSQLWAQVERVEPPFWWAGMNNPKLDILLYGHDLASYEVTIVPTLPIDEIRRVENSNYLFITIHTSGLPPSTFHIQLSKNDSLYHQVEYELKEREDRSADREGFNSSDVIYLLMPDRFANGNTQNDQTEFTREKVDRNREGGRHGGDIQGIIDHLDYLLDLGVTAIWSTPMLEDDEPVYSYHGYAQSDYYQIDPRFGSNEDYRRLADELHERDMKLIMDYVTNHWGSKHWLIEDLPDQNWIHHWADGEDGFRRSNYRMTTQFDPHVASVDAAGCMDGWFDVTMPDMNLKHPPLLTYSAQNAIWWIEFAGLDGLRVDTYPYNDKHAIAEWTRRIMAEYPNFNIVGEAWMHDQAQISYWQGDSPVAAIDGYNSYLPSVMDFTLHDAIMQAFHEDEQGWDRGLIRMYENFANDFLYSDINRLVVFAGNHDTQRLQRVFGGDVKKYQLAMTLIFTVRGIPQIYYGDEIGMEGNKDLGDGDIRRDFPGGWPGDETTSFTQGGRSELQNQYFEFTRKLLNWRKKKSLIHFGQTTHFIPQGNVYVYFRYDENEKVMVILNNSAADQTLDLQRFHSEIRDYSGGKDVISGLEIGLNQPLLLSAKTPYIFELN